MKNISKTDETHLKIIRENVRKFIAKHAAVRDRPGSHLLDIAPQNHEGAKPFFHHSIVETLDINPKSNATYIADLCRDNSAIISNQLFDVVVCTEVLEHVLNPFSAVSEILRILKPGGIVLVSTPFNFRIHGPLPDCWRFTEHGLRSLFNKESGYKILELDSLEDPNRFLMPIHYSLCAKKI